MFKTMLELKHGKAVLGSICMATILVWGAYKNSMPQHDQFFDSSSRYYPLGLKLWRNGPSMSWKPCPWWTESAEPRTEMGNTNGYIIVECSGGLNQMRRDFCNGVGIARLLNATIVLPRFETSPYWDDTSGFGEIFDIDFFLEIVQNWVAVLRELPTNLSRREPVAITCHKVTSPFDYVESLLPKLLQHTVIVLRPSASQRADRYPDSGKRARCHACFRSLRLVGRLQETADTIIERLPHPYVVLHLRFEPDMIAYSRCRYNLSSASIASIDGIRGFRQALGAAAEKSWRKRGKCPLTPQETAFILQALNIPASTSIYLAAGSGLLELHKLTSSYTQVFQKSDFLPADCLKALRGNMRAAIDWYVSLHAYAYIATFVGNMDKMVVSDRVFAGNHRNLVLDRHMFAEAQEQGMSEKEISRLIWENHRHHVTSGIGLPISGCFCKTCLNASLQECS